MKTIGMMLLDEVEDLDFVGPLEAFGVAKRVKPNSIRIVTFGTSPGEIRTSCGFRVRLDRGLASSDNVDILSVASGRGPREHRSEGMGRCA